MENKRLMDANPDMSEASIELTLRPQTIDEYVGQFAV